MGNNDQTNDSNSSADKGKATDQPIEKTNDPQKDVNARASGGVLGNVIDKLVKDDPKVIKKQDKAWADMKKDAPKQAENKGRAPYENLVQKVPDVSKNIDKYSAEKVIAESKNKENSPTEKKDQLSAGEKAERAKIAQPKDGIGFGYNKREASAKEMQRWWKSQSPDFRNAVKRGDSPIHLLGYASRPGDKGYNKQLSEDRNNFVKNWLINQQGANPKMFVEKAFGEESGERMKKDDNKDDSTDRIVSVRVLDADSTNSSETPSSGDAGKEGKAAADKTEFPKQPKGYSPEQGIKDITDEMAINVFLEIVGLEILGVAKTFIDTVIKLAEAIGECHDNNVLDAEVNAFVNSISVLHGDATNLENKHIKSGEPYTKEEFHRQAKKLWTATGVMNNAFSRVEATKDADRAYRKTTDQLCDRANRILKFGKNPEQRQAAMKKFTEYATKRFTELKLADINKRKK